MYLYYDVIDDKKVISVVSKTKLAYLGDNFVEKESVPESGILYLDDKDNIQVEEVVEDDFTVRLTNIEVALSEMMGGGE